MTDGPNASLPRTVETAEEIDRILGDGTRETETARGDSECERHPEPAGHPLPSMSQSSLLVRVLWRWSTLVCVDERLAEVDAASARLQHPLDQLLDLGAGQDEVGELVPTVSGDEHPARIVDQQRSCERWLSPKNDEECSELGRTRS